MKNESKIEPMSVKEATAIRRKIGTLHSSPSLPRSFLLNDLLPSFALPVYETDPRATTAFVSRKDKTAAYAKAEAGHNQLFVPLVEIAVRFPKSGTPAQKAAEAVARMRTEEDKLFLKLLAVAKRPDSPAQVSFRQAVAEITSRELPVCVVALSSKDWLPGGNAKKAIETFLGTAIRRTRGRIKTGATVQVVGRSGNVDILSCRNLPKGTVIVGAEPDYSGAMPGKEPAVFLAKEMEFAHEEVGMFLMSVSNVVLARLPKGPKGKRT